MISQRTTAPAEPRGPSAHVNLQRRRPAAFAAAAAPLVLACRPSARRRKQSARRWSGAGKTEITASKVTTTPTRSRLSVLAPSAPRAAALLSFNTEARRHTVPYSTYSMAARRRRLYYACRWLVLRRGSVNLLIRSGSGGCEDTWGVPLGSSMRHP